MITIHRSQGSVVKGVHYIYRTAEAIDEGVDFVHWRHGVPGMWVESDDGYVLELLKVKEYYDSRRSKISRYDLHTRFYWFGCARSTSWAKNLFIARHLKGMNHISGKSWQENFVTSRRGRAWIKLAAVMMFEKQLDLQILGEHLGFNRKYPDSVRIMAKRYLRDHLIENAIFLQMSEFLNQKGITADQTIEDYKKIKDKAIKDGKYNDAIKVLEKFERWTGLGDKIYGDKIEHTASQDIVGSRIQRMLEERANPKELPGGKQGLKVPASVSSQVFDDDGNRLEYVEVENQQSQTEQSNDTENQ